MPRSNSGPTGRTLTGGRAYYTGKNAYASQGFENDTRVSTLPALALLYFWGNQTIPAGGVDTTIPFTASYASGTFNPIFTRGIVFNPNDFSLYCQATGTYHFESSIRLNSLGPTDAAIMRIKVRRGNNERQFLQASTNISTTVSSGFTVNHSGYVDLVQGDYLFLTAACTSGATLAGGSTSTSPLGGLLESLQPTYLFLEQIDLT